MVKRWCFEVLTLQDSFSNDVGRANEGKGTVAFVTYITGDSV